MRRIDLLLLLVLISLVCSLAVSCAGNGDDEDRFEDDDSDDDDDDDDTDDSTGCTSCHGFPPNTGEHEEHDDYGCSTCHGAVVDAADLIIDSELHVDAEPNVTPGSGAYNPTTGVCSATGCHGNLSWF